MGKSPITWEKRRVRQKAKPAGNKIESVVWGQGGNLERGRARTVLVWEKSWPCKRTRGGGTCRFTSKKLKSQGAAKVPRNEVYGNNNENRGVEVGEFLELKRLGPPCECFWGMEGANRKCRTGEWCVKEKTKGAVRSIWGGKNLLCAEGRSETKGQWKKGKQQKKWGGLADGGVARAKKSADNQPPTASCT